MPSQITRTESSASWAIPLPLTEATTMVNKSVIASTGGRVSMTLARITCHIVLGAMRSSWKPRLSLGMDGVASAEDRNIEMNPNRKTSVQKPLMLRDGLKKVKAYPMG